MERRDRTRLAMAAYCRVSPMAKERPNHRRSMWKRIENISGGGMLVAWSRAEPETKAPHIGERYMVELRLPPHPVFGQRALQFKTKVVRVFEQPNGRVMAGLASARGTFKFVKPGAWPQTMESATVQ